MNVFQPVRFGKYLLLDKIAVGGMAELFRAKLIGVNGFEKIIAVKRILPHLCTEEDLDLVTAFIDEAKLAALLSHQCTIHIYDFGNVESSYYIAMEYIFGRDLRLIVRKCGEKGVRLPLEFSLFIVSKVCAGLDYAHGLKNYNGEHLGLVHRDISPQNILVTYEGEVKIVDFGIAKAATRSVKTQVGMIKGKVAYMSPEQADGCGIDYRSDIFSTGILLYELVTGKRMFQGNTLVILNKVRKANFMPAEEVAPELPPELFEILDRALARAPEERYSSCGEMQFEIVECIRSCGFSPSSNKLSLFMKNLFADEIQEEHKSMRKAAQLAECAEAESTKKEQPANQTRNDQLTHRLSSSFQEKGGNRAVFAIIAFGMVLTLLALFLFLGPGEEPVREIQAAPKEQAQFADATRPVETDSRDKTAKSKEVPPETESAAAQPEETETQAADGIPAGPSMAGGSEEVGAAGIGQAAPGEPRPSEPTKKASMKETPETQTADEQSSEREDFLAANGKSSARALFDDAVKALEEEKFAESILLFEELDRATPEMTREISEPYGRALVEQAAKHMKTNPERARELLEKAVEVNPAGPNAYARLGYLQMASQDFEKAIKSYQIAAGLRPDDPKPFFNIGYLYVRKKDYENAEDMYRRVVELKPDYLDEALFNLGVVQDMLGKKGPAKESLERALEINPDNESAKQFIEKLK